MGEANRRVFDRPDVVRFYARHDHLQAGEAAVLDILRQALWTALIVSTPILAVALIVGLAIGLVQALTSVQEMTLTFVPKVGLMLAVFWVTMSFMTSTLAGFFSDQVLPIVAGM